jgi:hypothetical protein
VARKKKKRAKKASVPATAPSPAVPKPKPTRRIIEPEQEPVEEKVRRYVALVSRRKLKELAEKPLPSTMSAAEIEDELRELLGE